MNAVATRNRPTTGPATFTTRSSTLVTYSVVTASDSLYGFKRWYEPTTGRWLSNDPIGISGGLNQYVFCGNNPVNCRDPFGLSDKSQSDYGHIYNPVNMPPTVVSPPQNVPPTVYLPPTVDPYLRAYLTGWASGYIPFPTSMNPGETVPWLVQPLISPRPNPQDYLVPNPMASPVRAFQSSLDEVGRQIEASSDPVQGWIWFFRRMYGF